MKKFLLTFMFFVPFILSAVIGPNVSIAPDGTELKWEEGAWDFFIMHKTLVERVTGEANNVGTDQDNTAKNPQADTCISETVGSTYTLTSEHIPPDADVDRAFLIWLAPIDPSKLNGPTDNSVTLTFTNATYPDLTVTKEVTAAQGYLNRNQNVQGNFEYEALYFPEDMSRPQQPIGETGIFTYRVEVSDFMKEIIAKGAEKALKPGEALYGDYNVKGMECSNDSSYLTTSGLMGGWFMPFVYTSQNIGAKKIYFYHGLQAYHYETSDITVSGFTLPDEAIIKLGLVVFEGDPGLASSMVLDSSSPNYMQSAPLEGLSISGHDPNDFAPLFNNCNPLTTTTDQLGMTVNYTEMFNSISSVFGWESSSDYWCVGNPNQLWPMDTTNPLEYAIDADILVVDSSPNGPFQGRFLKDDKQFILRVGANQDQVLTNMLIVSVDTKLPQFDIPDKREKDFCSCSKDADTVCADRPFYYTIKVQNHGSYPANNVTVQDTLPPQVEYMPGTTEIATKFDANGLGTDWTPVPDIDGKFPYATAQKVADTLKYCDSPTNCGEGTTAWIRFEVKPKSNLSKNEVIKNSAFISSMESEMPYHSNSSIPLRLTFGSCPAITECELPPKMQCGGVRIDNENYCAGDSDCKDGKKCVNNECVLDVSGDLTTNATVSFDIGQNSPGKGDTSEIFVPNPSEKLVLGQFYLLSEDNSGKVYEFHTVSLKLDKDSEVNAKNLKLYKDVNGNGKVDEGDVEIAKADSLKSTYYIEFATTDQANRFLKSGIKHHFIVTTDVSSTSEDDSKFKMLIEGYEAFKITDKGTVTVKGAKTEFANYRFEPASGFIFTKGQYDPQIPSYKDFNGKHEMLQVRTKSIAMTNKITSIKIKTSASMAKFGEGIKSISLILDKDNNGIESAGDEVLKKLSSFDSGTSATFDKLDIPYNQDEEKYLIFKAEFKMSVNDKAKITVQNVKLENGTAKGIPLSSKEFEYKCDPTDPNSCSQESDDDDEGGCAILAVPEDSSNALYLVFAAFAALLALAGIKVSVSKK